MTASRKKVAAGIAAAGIYLGSVALANWLTTHCGFVSVGFGALSTAGTFAAGGALIVRDLLQDTIGRVGVLLLIMVASAASYLIAAPAVALASGVAFALAELLDMVAYTPLRRRGRFGGRWWAAAILAGGVIGAIADTVAFLWIAFGWPAVGPALKGQLIGKAEVIVGLLLVLAVSRAVLRKPVD